MCCEACRPDFDTLNKACREYQNVSVPVWAKVLAGERPFCSPRESGFSVPSQLASGRLVQVHLRHAPGPHQARGPGNSAQELRRQNPPNHTTYCTITHSTAPTSNAARVRTIVSRCRGRLAVSAYPHLQIRPRQWANVSASSPPLRARAVAPPLAPKMDIINYSFFFYRCHVSQGPNDIYGHWVISRDDSTAVRSSAAVGSPRQRMNALDRCSKSAPGLGCRRSVFPATGEPYCRAWLR